MRNPLTPAGIEPATFWFVAQQLHHCATAVPNTGQKQHKKQNYTITNGKEITTKYKNTIIIIISFMQGIYTCIPETNDVPREHNVAAILLLLFMVSVLNLLYFHISTFWRMCAMPNMAVFCSSLTSCFFGMLLTYFLNDFEIVRVVPIITGITSVFTFHVRCISIVRAL